jgi:hypothetical protein
LRIILLLSPSMSMSRVVTLWPSIKYVSNIPMVFPLLCFGLKMHMLICYIDANLVLMLFHNLCCRICNSCDMEIIVVRRNCKLLELTIKGYRYIKLRFLF